MKTKINIPGSRFTLIHYGNTLLRLSLYECLNIKIYEYYIFKGGGAINKWTMHLRIQMNIKT